MTPVMTSVSVRRVPFLDVVGVISLSMSSIAFALDTLPQGQQSFVMFSSRSLPVAVTRRSATSPPMVGLNHQDRTVGAHRLRGRRDLGVTSPYLFWSYSGNALSSDRVERGVVDHVDGAVWSDESRRIGFQARDIERQIGELVRTEIPAVGMTVLCVG